MARQEAGQDIAPLLAPFVEVSNGLYKRAREWRSITGGKVIGCVPMYVPEELVHAAGMLPINLFGGEEAITLADRYIQPSLSCGLMRSNLDLALKGKLDFLDGVIIPDICEPTNQIADVWLLHKELPLHHNLMLPQLLDSPRSRPYVCREFTRLKSALERLGGTITEPRLRQSIAIYNENRRLLSRLYALRRQRHFPLHASEVADIVLAGMLMPKEDHNKLLARLLSALDAGVSSGAGNAPRILLAGYTCDRPERYVLDFIEGLGAAVVDDEMHVGRRYFKAIAPDTMDPIEALTERFLAGLPCCTLRKEQRWASYVLSLAREANADGVLVVAPKYCDALAFEYPSLKSTLDAERIPHLWMELEERGSGIGQVKNRLQAFVELVLARTEED